MVVLVLPSVNQSDEIAYIDHCTAIVMVIDYSEVVFAYPTVRSRGRRLGLSSLGHSSAHLVPCNSTNKTLHEISCR